MAKKNSSSQPSFPKQTCDGSVSCAPANQNMNVSPGSGRKTQNPPAQIYRGPKGTK